MLNLCLETHVTLRALSVLIWELSREGLLYLLQGYCEVEMGG